jgi:GNAT superfamily N-acetyltransferase
MTDVVSLAKATSRDVARVLTDAFVDDPGWRDVGPDRARHRRVALRAYHRALARKALQWGRPGYAAFRSGQLVGVAVTFASDAWPPPEPISTLLDVPAFALAGPPAALRGWRANAIITRAHFRDPHLFLWQLAVDLPVQRSGVGHTLMERVLADAPRPPSFLSTSKPPSLRTFRTTAASASSRPATRGCPVAPRCG